MAKFTARPLGILENIYRFIGGQTGPNEVQLDGGIQMVHDVSREAEVGTAQTPALGYTLSGATVSHVGTGDLFSAIDIYDRAFETLDPIDVDVWAIDALCTVNDPGDFASASLGIRYPLLSGAFESQQDHLLYSWTTPGGALRAGGDTTVPGVAIPVELPKYLPHGSSLLLQSTADNVGTISINIWLLLWVGARSALPPGMP